MSDLIREENPADGVRRVVLASPQNRNAQSPDLLYQLDDAFAAAAADDDVRVIILAADGPDFSSGHDLKAGFKVPAENRATLAGGYHAPGIEGHHAFECEAFIGLCRRWRDLPKPTIAQTHGRNIAGALMLLWPMDLIIAADDATFSDPVTAFGANGVEYFAHAFELGARKAKELLFAGGKLTAAEAHTIGMVNHVVPVDDLAGFTLELAERIAARPPYALQLAKKSVNQSQDVQGLTSAIDGAFALHTLAHANNLAKHGQILDPAGFEIIRNESRAT